MPFGTQFTLSCLFLVIFLGVQIMRVLLLSITLNIGTVRVQPLLWGFKASAQVLLQQNSSERTQNRSRGWKHSSSFPERPILLHQYKTEKVSTVTPKQRPLRACKVIPGNTQSKCTFCCMWIPLFSLYCRRNSAFTTMYLPTETVVLPFILLKYGHLSKGIETFVWTKVLKIRVPIVLFACR